MTKTKSICILATILISISACEKAPEAAATVHVTVNGQALNYENHSAQIDLGGGETHPSLYFLRDDDDKPSLSLRYYQAQPVAKLWLNWKNKNDDALRRYSCFVPGQLADGRSTLNWTKADGSAREKNATGQAECQVTLQRSDTQITMHIDAKLHLARPAKKKKHAPAQENEKQPAATNELHLVGQATLHLK